MPLLNSDGIQIKAHVPRYLSGFSARNSVRTLRTSLDVRLHPFQAHTITINQSAAVIHQELGGYMRAYRSETRLHELFGVNRNSLKIS